MRHTTTCLLALLYWTTLTTAQSTSSTAQGPGPTQNQVISLYLPQAATTNVQASVIYANASLTAYALGGCPSTTTPPTSPTPLIPTTTTPRLCQTTTITFNPTTLIYTITFTDEESTPETRTTIISPSRQRPSTTTLTHYAPHNRATINCLLLGSPTPSSARCTWRSHIRDLGIQVSTINVPSESIAMYPVTITAAAGVSATVEPTRTRTKGGGGQGGSEDGDDVMPFAGSTSSNGNGGGRCTRLAGWGVAVGVGIGVWV